MLATNGNPATSGQEEGRDILDGGVEYCRQEGGGIVGSHWIDTNGDRGGGTDQDKIC
jgi:hypothetical protein